MPAILETGLARSPICTSAEVPFVNTLKTIGVNVLVKHEYLKVHLPWISFDDVSR